VMADEPVSGSEAETSRPADVSRAPAKGVAVESVTVDRVEVQTVTVERVAVETVAGETVAGETGAVGASSRDTEPHDTDQNGNATPERPASAPPATIEPSGDGLAAPASAGRSAETSSKKG